MTASLDPKTQKILEATLKKAREVWGNMSFGGIDLSSMFAGAILHNDCGFEYFVSKTPEPVPECPVCTGKWKEFGDELRKQEIKVFYLEGAPFFAKVMKELKEDLKGDWKA